MANHSATALTTTYVARLTGTSPSAVAVVAVEGMDAARFLHQCWRSVSGKESLSTNRIYYGFWCGTDSLGSAGSEDVIVCRTSENRFEIHCHGGLAASARIVSNLKECGAVECSGEMLAGHFPRDPLQAQAALDLQGVKTVKSIQVLLAQANGRLSHALYELMQSNDRSWKFQRCLQLLKNAHVGLQLLCPPAIAILGSPNAGKSTLLNALLGWDRAIVHATPGTTRDAIREEISLQGWPLSVVDTAGLRATDDAIELQGISIATEVAENAAAILMLVDSTSAWTEWHEQIMNDYGKKVIVVRSKSDLDGQPSQELPSIAREAVAISALYRKGLEDLIAAILVKLGFDDECLTQPVPFRQSHVDALSEAATCVGDDTRFNGCLAKLLEKQ